MGTMARVLGGGAHEVNLWCYVAAGLWLWIALTRKYGC